MAAPKSPTLPVPPPAGPATTVSAPDGGEMRWMLPLVLEMYTFPEIGSAAIPAHTSVVPDDAERNDVVFNEGSSL